MDKPDRALQELARHVIRTGAEASPATTTAAADAMQGSCGELYRILEAAMGPAGLQALLGRAVQIASRDHPWLGAVKTGTAADCPLSGLSEAAARLDVDEAMNGYAALLATIVWLLITFIGHDLTLRFVRTAWPNVSLRKLSEGLKE